MTKIVSVVFRNYLNRNDAYDSKEDQLYYYKIPGLTNKFILANDDTVAIRKLLPTDFFIDNSIVYGNTIYHNEWVPDREIGSKCYVETLYHTALAAGIPR